MLAGAVKKPARPATDLARLAEMKCTRSVKPSSAHSPAPPGPWVPSECDSSTRIMLPCFSTTSIMSASGHTEPVVL